MSDAVKQAFKSLAEEQLAAFDSVLNTVRTQQDVIDSLRERVTFLEGAFLDLEHRFEALEKRR